MIRIVNKTGRGEDTTIIHVETGAEIKGVYGVEIDPFNGDPGFIGATLRFNRVELDVSIEDENIEGAQI